MGSPPPLPGPAAPKGWGTAGARRPRPDTSYWGRLAVGPAPPGRGAQWGRTAGGGAGSAAAALSDSGGLRRSALDRPGSDASRGGGRAAGGGRRGTNTPPGGGPPAPAQPCPPLWGGMGGGYGWSPHQVRLGGGGGGPSRGKGVLCVRGGAGGRWIGGVSVWGD